MAVDRGSVPTTFEMAGPWHGGSNYGGTSSSSYGAYPVKPNAASPPYRPSNPRASSPFDSLPGGYDTAPSSRSSSSDGGGPSAPSKDQASLWQTSS